MMGMLALSFFLLIGIRSGCRYRLLGGGLMILLSGIKGLGIFGRWRLPLMPGILWSCWRSNLVSRCLIWGVGLDRLLSHLRRLGIL